MDSLKVLRARCETKAVPVAKVWVGGSLLVVCRNLDDAVGGSCTLARYYWAGGEWRADVEAHRVTMQEALGALERWSRAVATRPAASHFKPSSGQAVLNVTHADGWDDLAEHYTYEVGSDGGAVAIRCLDDDLVALDLSWFSDEGLRFLRGVEAAAS